ncbi:MAG: lactate utilization protein [Desulfovibrionaceae bacterium]|jgi:L-lactate dehydrogenase complex protein LldG|nr:lactate utilization protein [Desulfovibrionaceae bacterium]
MSNARENILARLRAARAERVPDYIPRWSPAHPEGDELVALAVKHMEATRTLVLRVAPSEIGATVRDLLRQRSVTNLLRAPDTWVGELLDAQWPGDGECELLTWDHAAPDYCRDVLFPEAQASITTVKALVADEGAVVLWPTPSEPRTMSLVPPLHIAAVRVGQILPSLAEAVAAFDWAVNRPNNAVLISGPSRSGDIENTLRIGVHGPMELVVLLVDD